MEFFQLALKEIAPRIGRFRPIPLAVHDVVKERLTIRFKRKKFNEKKVDFFFHFCNVM